MNISGMACAAFPLDLTTGISSTNSICSSKATSWAAPLRGRSADNLVPYLMQQCHSLLQSRGMLSIHQSSGTLHMESRLSSWAALTRQQRAMRLQCTSTLLKYPPCSQAAPIRNCIAGTGTGQGLQPAVNNREQHLPVAPERQASAWPWQAWAWHQESHA